MLPSLCAVLRPGMSIPLSKSVSEFKFAKENKKARHQKLYKLVSAHAIMECPHSRNLVDLKLGGIQVRTLYFNLVVLLRIQDLAIVVSAS